MGCHPRVTCPHPTRTPLWHLPLHRRLWRLHCAAAPGGVRRLLSSPRAGRTPTTNNFPMAPPAIPIPSSHPCRARNASSSSTPPSWRGEWGWPASCAKRPRSTWPMPSRAAGSSASSPPGQLPSPPHKHLAKGQRHPQGDRRQGWRCPMDTDGVLTRRLPVLAPLAQLLGFQKKHCLACRTAQRADFVTCITSGCKGRSRPPLHCKFRAIPSPRKSSMAPFSPRALLPRVFPNAAQHLYRLHGPPDLPGHRGRGDVSREPGGRFGGFGGGGV